MMKIVVDNKEFYQNASMIISVSIKKILYEKENVIIGLPGGRSVSAIFKLLKS